MPRSLPPVCTTNDIDCRAMQEEAVRCTTNNIDCCAVQEEVARCTTNDIDC
ncbi:hypothetical protein DFH07DRAFT_967611 [Mycena maculata]|uniref:Uncharacterized protein n=1 Tax=Mycena maculata TaxID=230809 RepID=A0AAD7I3Y1_9AGAR|nr:hypothetical protein DFH07DRAFT_967611 [Mycena maculata]